MSQHLCLNWKRLTINLIPNRSLAVLHLKLFEEELSSFSVLQTYLLQQGVLEGALNPWTVFLQLHSFTLLKSVYLNNILLLWVLLAELKDPPWVVPKKEVLPAVDFEFYWIEYYVSVYVELRRAVLHLIHTRIIFFYVLSMLYLINHDHTPLLQVFSKM